MNRRVSERLADPCVQNAGDTMLVIVRWAISIRAQSELIITHGKIENKADQDDSLSPELLFLESQRFQHDGATPFMARTTLE